MKYTTLLIIAGSLAIANGALITSPTGTIAGTSIDWTVSGFTTNNSGFSVLTNATGVSLGNLSFTGLAAGESLAITVSFIADGNTGGGNPITWGGSGNAAQTTTWAGNAGTASFVNNLPGQLTLTSSGPASVTGVEANNAAPSYGDDWGSITFTGATQIDYFLDAVSTNTGGADGFSFSVEVIPAPEPSSAALLGLGGLALLGRRKRS